MLFSNDRVVDYINRTFEPAWQSVRPVPTVTVDFGNGKTIRRTLRGNIATYVCNGNGQTLDILPGIYEPETYLAQLKQMKMLASWTDGELNPAELVKDYHRRQAKTLSVGSEHLRIVARPAPRVSILAVEAGTRYTLMTASQRERLTNPGRVASLRREIPNLDSPQELAEWKPLFDDTKLNESTRRRQIHEHLAEKGLVAPTDMTKWLYREVLDADLDDPYLGLGKILKAETEGR